MKHLLIILSILLLSFPLFGQSTQKYESVSQCVLQTMTEKKLTGNQMFELVKEECERILGKVETVVKKKETGILFRDTPFSKWEESGKKWLRTGDEKTQVKYEGEIRNNVPHGNGVLSFEGEQIHVGEFKDGLKNGQGTSILPDGHKYEGEWKEGELHGQGTYTFPNGNKGIGEFREDKPLNITEYDKYGNIIGKYVNGKYIEQ